MRYLYTTKPDDACHEVEKGIHGRPCHTSEQPKLRKAGWVFNINELRGTDHVRQGKEEGQESKEVSRSIPEAQLDQLSSSGGEVEVKRLDDCDISDEDKQEIILNMLRVEYERHFGKPPHHKMKAETIRKKLEESDD